eukprot:PhF_6_TR22533/c0_g1_i1/m.32004
MFWRMTVALTFILYVSSTTYMFSSFSAQLAQTLHFQPTEINLIASCSNLGTWAGIISGFLADRLGTRITAALGGVLSAIGYLCFAGAVAGYVCSSTACMAVYAFVWAQGNNWTYFASMKHMYLVVNQKDTALMTGVLVCLYSVAAGGFSQMYRGWFLEHNQLSEFFIFIAIMCATFSVGGAFVLQPADLKATMSPFSDSDRKWFRWAIGYSLVVIGCAVIAAVVSIEVEHAPAGALAWMMILVMGAACFGVLIDKYRARNGGTFDVIQDETVASPALDDSNATPMITSEFSILETLRHSEYYLCLLVVMCGIGSGIVLLNNVGTIVPAFQRGYGAYDGAVFEHASDLKLKKWTTSGVTLFAVCNALGRLGFGYFATVLRIPRWRYLVLALSLLTLGHLITFGFNIPSLFVALCFCGVGYGGIFCMAPTLVRDLFGKTAFGVNWGLMGLAPAVPSITVAAVLAGHILDTEMEVHSYKVEGKSYCLGEGCYKVTFVVNLCMALVGLTSAVL